MSHLCIVHSGDGAPWADYTITKLLNKFPDLKVATVPDHKAFSNCTSTDPGIPEAEAIILIASPDLLEFLRVNSDVVFNAKVNRYVKHCLVLLLGLDKAEMDERSDHFRSYERWTHLTLTDDQQDLVKLFQNIIEIMQQVVNSRTVKQQQLKQPLAGAKPKPKPKPKPHIMKQHCVDVVSSSDELERSHGAGSGGKPHVGGGNEAQKARETVPGLEPLKSQSDKTTSRDDTLEVVPGCHGDSLSVNITPATPQPEEEKPEQGNKEAEEEGPYSRDLVFVKGTALIKSELAEDIGNEDQRVQPRERPSMKRRETATDDDDTIYENSELQTVADTSRISPLRSAEFKVKPRSPNAVKSSDLNGNLVKKGAGMSTSSDDLGNDLDDVDGPSAHVFGADTGAHAHRPRSHLVSDNEGKRFHRRSAALRFTLSPSTIDGDDEREVLLVFERALRGDSELDVMLAGVPDYPPRTLHSIVNNPYNIKVIVPKLQPGRVQLRLVKKNITCGSQHLDVISTNCDMIGLSQLYLTTLNLVCTSQRRGGAQGGGAQEGGAHTGNTDNTDNVHTRQAHTHAQDSHAQHAGSTSPTESDALSPRILLDKHIIQLFDDNEIPIQAFEKVFGVYEEAVERDETMSGDLPSLLHFSARYGLCELTSRLVDLPGAREACNLRNRHGYKPAHLATLHKHTELADFLEQYSQTVDTREEIYAQMRQFFERRTSKTSLTSLKENTVPSPGSAKCRAHARKSYTDRDVPPATAPPPALNESDEYMTPTNWLPNTPDKKGRRLDKVVPPPPGPRGRGGYINTPSEDQEVYENAPGKNCPYDNAHRQNSGGAGATGDDAVVDPWDAPVPPTSAPAPPGGGNDVTRQDSYLEPMSPGSENYERLDSGDMIECNKIRAAAGGQKATAQTAAQSGAHTTMRTDSEEELYISMHSRTDENDENDDYYMSMGGVKREMDTYLNTGRESARDSYVDMGRKSSLNSYINTDGAMGRRTPRFTDSSYMAMDSSEFRASQTTSDGYLVLSKEEEDFTSGIPPEYLKAENVTSASTSSWDDEVPLVHQVPLSPAYMLKEIQGVSPTTGDPPPGPCTPLPGYIKMGGSSVDGAAPSNQKHGYVNEDVLLQQRTDLVEEAYSTTTDTMATAHADSPVPPPPFHENSFSGRDESIAHGPSLGNVTSDMFHSRSQKELLDILNMAKHKEINIHEAELLFSSWQQQYNSGNTQSFKDKRDQMKQMQNEFDVARRNLGGASGSTERLNAPAGGAKKGFLAKWFRSPRKKSGDITCDAEQMKRLTKSTGSESSLTDSVDGPLEARSRDTSLEPTTGTSRVLQAVKESSRLSTVSNSSSSSNGSRMSCSSISSTHDSGIDELNQADRNSAHLAEEVVKSDVYPKPPPVPKRTHSARRPLPPVPGEGVSTTGGARGPSPGVIGARGRAIPRKTPASGSRIPGVKAKSQEALDTISSLPGNSEAQAGGLGSDTPELGDHTKPQTLPKPRRGRGGTGPGYERVVLGLNNNPLFMQQRKITGPEQAGSGSAQSGSKFTSSPPEGTTKHAPPHRSESQC